MTNKNLHMKQSNRIDSTLRGLCAALLVAGSSMVSAQVEVNRLPHLSQNRLPVAQDPNPAVPGSAGGFEIWEEYSKRFKSKNAVVALGPEALGDEVSLYDGTLSFSATDIDLGGNGSIDVGFSRMLAVRNQSADSRNDYMLADWDVDIPRLEGVFSANAGWIVAGSNDFERGQRCSRPAAPFMPGSVGGGQLSPNDVWSGTSGHFPGGGELLVASSTTPVPQDGQTYPWVTTGYSYLRCINSQQSGFHGEAFEALAPDGTRYEFTWMGRYYETPVSRSAEDAQPATLDRRRIALYATRVVDRFGNEVRYEFFPTTPDERPLLKAITTYSRAESGTSITQERRLEFSYDPDHGFIATATLHEGSAVPRVWHYRYTSQQISVQTRYSLSEVELPDGSKWELDLDEFSASEIVFVSENRHCASPSVALKLASIAGPQRPGDVATGTIKHPAGVSGRFEVFARTLTRAHVPLYCENLNDEDEFGNPIVDYTNDVPGQKRDQIVLALRVKDLQGPSLPTQRWDYSYQSRGNWLNPWNPNMGTPPPACVDPATCANPVCLDEMCAQSNVALNFTTVRGPEIAGSPVNGRVAWKRMTFGNSYRYDEGKLYKVEQGYSDPGGNDKALRTDTSRYRLWDTFPPSGVSPVGQSLRIGGDQYVAEYKRPAVRQATLQQDHCFLRESSAFDAFERPTLIERSRRIGTEGEGNEVSCEADGLALVSGFIDDLTYHDDMDTWVLGQTERIDRSDLSTAALTVPQRSTFNALGQPQSVFAFEKLQRHLTYHDHGQPKDIYDGSYGGINPKKTTLGSYKLGIPQSVDYADGKSESATVNDRGEIEEHVSASNAETSYRYDDMGRLIEIVYHEGDTSIPASAPGALNWHATSIAFEPITEGEFGFSSGTWKRTVKTGDLSNGYAVNETFYDELWRPLLSREFDDRRESVTQRVTRWQYDQQGMQSYVSYPTNDDAEYSVFGPGTRTLYDGLGRVVRQSADAEAPLGQTHQDYEYLTGFITRMTNARGKVTEMQYLAFDDPMTDWPVRIDAPGKDDFQRIVTRITRDIYGKPLAIARGTGANEVKREFVYDTHQRLCRQYDPEAGWSVRTYDVSDNLQWLAIGQPAAAAGQCADGPVPTDQRSVFEYDRRNRPTEVDHPNGTADLSLEYEADGLLKSLSVIDDGAVINRWDYAYNFRRLLELETLTVLGRTYTLDHNYDRYGSPSELIYPDGTALSYAPNRLGQPLAVGDLADGIEYQPSGAVAKFDYGNDVHYESTPNTRQLPGRIQISHGIVDENYSWDAVGNLLGVYDQRSPMGSPSRTRDFIYDPANRLTDAIYEAPGLGPYGYEYDIHDNITRATRPVVLGGNRNYNYNGSNRRLDSLTNDNGQNQIVYSYDANGNAIGRNASGLGLDNFGYFYDRANRLLEVRDPVNAADVKARYQYDGHARRVVIEEGDDKRVQIYSRAGQYVYEEPDLISNADFRGDTLVPLKSTTRYQYLGTMLVAKSSGNQTTYLHTDHLGSPIAESSAAPVLVTHLPLHEPYGAPSNGHYLDGPGYTGHVVDGLTGLSYMQARYYDPVAGRFLGVDPVGVHLASGKNFNRYWYGDANPLRFVDPDGRYKCVASSDECKTIARYVDGIRRAAKNSRGSTRTKINKIVGYLGTENDGQGPTIKVDDLKDFDAAKTDGKGNITIDLKEIASKENDLARGSMALAHEAQHDIDIDKDGTPKTEQQVRTLEERAYEIQAKVGAKLDFSMTREHIQEAVDKSVKNWVTLQEKKIQQAMLAMSMSR